ncbi:MAG TPA: LysR family transcriptional regulator [Kofleriaceae bacterium]|jgi:LysR family transcriptional activator of nhaA
MLNYNHLYYFHVAATEGSVAGAAEKLGVTQPTVSEQVRVLERSLHVVLFERSPSGLRLTDAGRLAFEHTSVMFRAGERLAESLGHESRDMPRSLRIGVSGAVARATSSDFLMPLLALPDCSPVIRTGDSVDHVRGLRGAELDLVLCENEPPDAARRGLEIVMIAKTTLVAVTPPSVTAATDWQDVGLVHYRPTSSYRWEIDAYLAANKLVPRVVGEADDSSFLLEAAARGGYVAIVPRAIARERIASGQLKVLAQFEPSQSGVFAMFQSGSSADLARRAVDILIEHVKAQID